MTPPAGEATLATREPSAPATTRAQTAPAGGRPAAAAPGSNTTSGAIGAKYATASAASGAPTSQEFSPERFGGAYQLFERGTIAYLQEYGAYMVVNGINAVWTSIGAQDSDLGYPTSDEYSPMAGGVMQNFQFGKISWNPVTGSRITKGGIGVTWDNAGGPLSGLGYPTTDEYSPVPGGIMQGFQYGKISWNPVTGSRITKGGIGATWDKVGGPASGLGYATTDEYATSNGGVTQEFQYGQIVWSPATGSRFIKGGIGATWIGIGGPRSVLGYPTSDEIGGLRGGGAKQFFQRGEVIWSPGAGSYVITGGIRSAWAGQGSEAGRLGYPSTNEYGVTGGSAQDFQGGRITWYPGRTRIEYASDAYRPAPAPAPSVPTEYKSALSKAGSYSRIMHMSKRGIYDQLTSPYGEKFSPQAAQYAVDNLQADYKANALEKAKSYQKLMSMSPASIRDQLTSEYGEKFTPEEADYAVQNLG
jgi:uncharacterized protein with LGFP repeats